MTHRSWKRLLKSWTFGSLLAAGGILSVCLLRPCDLPGSGEPTAERTKPMAVKELHTRPTRQQFAQVERKTLRRPLVDPVAEKTAARAARRAPPPAVRLIGVAFEGDHSLALMSNPQGQIEVKGVGEMIGEDTSGMQILKIEAQSVELQHQGETITLRLQEESLR